MDYMQEERNKEIGRYQAAMKAKWAAPHVFQPWPSSPDVCGGCLGERDDPRHNDAGVNAIGVADIQEARQKLVAVCGVSYL